MNLAIARRGLCWRARADPEPTTMGMAQMRPTNLLFTWAKCLVCVCFSEYKSQAHSNVCSHNLGGPKWRGAAATAMKKFEPAKERREL
jgi:hypothetical protein